MRTETDPLKIYETFRKDELDKADAVRKHGLRMELHFSSGKPQWFVFAGDMPIAQYSHRGLAALHLIMEKYV